MAKNITMTEAEERLAGLIWREGPLMSPELAILAEGEFGWKKSTTYTLLRRLCNKGVLRNENARVSAVYTREEQTARQSYHYIADTFGGSLPQFVASFIRSGNLSSEEVSEIRQLIDEYDEDGGHD